MLASADYSVLGQSHQNGSANDKLARERASEREHKVSFAVQISQEARASQEKVRLYR